MGDMYSAMVVLAICNSIYAYRYTRIFDYEFDWSIVFIFTSIKFILVFCFYLIADGIGLHDYISDFELPFFLKYSATIFEDFCFVLPILFYKERKYEISLLVVSTICFSVFHWGNAIGWHQSLYTVLIKIYVISYFYAISKIFNFKTAIMVHYTFDLSVYVFYTNL